MHDLVNAFDKVRTNIDKTAGQIYNVGGGMSNSVSLVEVIDQIEDITGKCIRFTTQRPRPGDQLFYVTDYDKLRKHTGWKPQRNVRQTIQAIYGWWKEHKQEERVPAASLPSSIMAGMPEAAS